MKLYRHTNLYQTIDIMSKYKVPESHDRNYEEEQNFLTRFFEQFPLDNVVVQGKTIQGEPMYFIVDGISGFLALTSGDWYYALEYDTFTMNPHKYFKTVDISKLYKTTYQLEMIKKYPEYEELINILGRIVQTSAFPVVELDYRFTGYDHLFE